MHPDVVAALQCPCCRGAMSSVDRTVRCRAGHSFDLARSGYLNLVVGRGAGIAGDDGTMLSARARILEAGHFAPLSSELASLARAAAAGLAVEIGAGTAHYLARVLDALPSHAGLALDVSVAAARRAARAHPRVDAVVADVRGTLPLADACAGLALVVFAPRNAAELRRILRHDGSLLVATPRPEHLHELRSAFHLLQIDPDKRRRLDEALSPAFVRVSSRELRWEMTLTAPECEALVAMGPSGRHASSAALSERAGALPETNRVTAGCDVDVWRPR